MSHDQETTFLNGMVRVIESVRKRVTENRRSFFE